MAVKRIGIVGGGVAGLFSAWHLLRQSEGESESEVKVTLMEKGGIGRGTSWDAAGMLAPVNELDFQEIALFRAGLKSRELYENEVVGQLGEIGFRKSGTVEIGLTADDTGYLRRLYEFQRENEQEVEWLSGAAIREREPFIGQHIGAGIWSAGDSQVDNRLLVKALGEDLRRRGADILEKCEVNGWEDAAGGCIKVQTAGGELEFDQLLVAPGTPGRALQGLLPYTIYPVKGEMLSLALPRETEMGFLQATVRIRSKTWGNAYLVPKTDRIVCGSTSEEKGPDRRNTAGGILEILRKCYAAVPGIYELDLQETWAGLRPSTLSRQPILDREPKREVYHLNGLYRHGILLGPLMGKAAAQLMLHGTRMEEVKPFTL